MGANRFLYRNEAAWCYLEGFGGKKDKVSIYLPLPSRSSLGKSLSAFGLSSGEPALISKQEAAPNTWR